MKLSIEANGCIRLPAVKVASHDGYFHCTMVFLNDEERSPDLHRAVPCLIFESSRATCKEDLPCLGTSLPLHELLEKADCHVHIAEAHYSLDYVIEMYFGYARGLAGTAMQQVVESADARLAAMVDRINHQVDPSDRHACDSALKATQYLLCNAGCGMSWKRSRGFEYIHGFMDRAIETATERACSLRHKHACAARIQRCYKRAFYDPSYALCRKRLARDFERMANEICAH